MRHYEIVLLFHTENSDQVDKLIAGYQKTITDSAGKIHRFEDWGKLKLSYEIKNQKSAKYILMNIECSTEVVENLKQSFRYNDLILRDLVIKKDEADMETSQMLQQLKSKQENNKERK